MHSRLLALLAAVMLLVSADPAAAKAWFIQAGSDLTFSPQTLTIQAGDTVTFRNRGGFHNAVADDGSFRCAQGCENDGAGGDGGLSSVLWRATLAFPEAGTYGYFCEAHGAPGEGMFGTIIVQDLPPPLAVPIGPVWKVAAVLCGTLFVSAVLRRRRTHPRNFM